METQVAVLKVRFEDLLEKVDRNAGKMDQLIERLDKLNNRLTGFGVYFKVLWPTVTVLVGIIGWLAGVKF